MSGVTRIFGGERDMVQVPSSWVVLGINCRAPASKFVTERFEEKIRELSDGFERLLAIERVRDAPGPFLSGTTPAPSKGRGPMISLWSSFKAEPRCQGRRADYSANTLPGHPLRL